ncbi:hypothetical protein JGU66_28110 [Myxococcaceae bacterium JPH2]|nr:hypothetical protein [Myxococcaceae bacterium JPH2]
MCTSLVAVLCWVGGAWGTTARAEPLLSDAELKAALERLGTQDRPADHSTVSEDELPSLDVDPPRLLLRDAVKEQLAPRVTVQRFAEMYALPDEAARAVLTAVLLAEGNIPVADSSLERALRSLQLAAKVAPNSLVPVATLISSWLHWQSPQALRTLRELLLAAPDPVAWALKLRPVADTHIARFLWIFAVGERPALLPQALASLRPEDSSPEACAFLQSALDSPSFPEQVLPRNAQRVALMKCLLNEGLPELALQQLEALPPEEVRGALLHQAATRLDVAAAFLIRGDKTQAQAWLPTEAELIKDDPMATSPRMCETRAPIDVLKALLAPVPPADAFYFLGQMQCVTSRYPWSRFMSELLARQCPERTRELLEWAARARHPIDEAGPEAVEVLLPFIAKSMSVIRAESSRHEVELRQALAALPRLGLASTQSREALGRRLNASRLGGFMERTDTPETAGRAVVVPVQSVMLPNGFDAVLAQRLSSDHLVAVASSSLLDPWNEVSRGGYWVLFSEDKGRTWSEPLYTGLRVNDPFELAVEEHGPLVVGKTLRFEVVRRELIRESTSVRYWGSQFREEPRRRILEVDLDRLRLDSDHDSLPDIVEEHLFLDPNCADTDGDGRSDAVDPLPRSARAAGPKTAPAEIITHFLASLAETESSTPPDTKGAKKTRIPLHQTTFVISEPSDLDGVEEPGRIIAVSPAEARLLEQRLGEFYMVDLNLSFNAAGDQALLVWRSRGYGGTFLVTRTPEGTWTIKAKREWVS